MKKRAILIPISLILLAYLIYSYFTQGFVHSLINISPESLSSLSSGNLILAGIIFVLIMIIEVVFAPFHPLLFYIAGGIMFGPVVAIILAVLGGVIGGIIAFYIARKWEENMLKEKFPKLKERG